MTSILIGTQTSVSTELARNLMNSVMFALTLEHSILSIKMKLSEIMIISKFRNIVKLTSN